MWENHPKLIFFCRDFPTLCLFIFLKSTYEICKSGLGGTDKSFGFGLLGSHSYVMFFLVQVITLELTIGNS